MIAAALLLALAAPAQHLNYQGVDRAYRVHRPANLPHNRRAPLVVVLHGGFGTGAQAEKSYGWDAVADRYGFIVAYPDGIGRSWHAGPQCCAESMKRDLDDVGFLNTVIRTIESSENVDPKRIVVTGMSNGAMMSYRMACESPLPLLGIAPVAGTTLVPCSKPQQLSILEIHGTADRNIPFNGGLGQGPGRVTTPPIPDLIAQWRSREHCDTPATRTAGTVTTTSAQCAHQTRVELIAVSGAGHQWPGSLPPSAAWVALAKRLDINGLDQPSNALNATQTIAAFFGLTR